MTPKPRYGVSISWTAEQMALLQAHLAGGELTPGQWLKAIALAELARTKEERARD